jgi:hypothetical protein
MYALTGRPKRCPARPVPALETGHNGGGWSSTAQRQVAVLNEVHRASKASPCSLIAGLLGVVAQVKGNARSRSEARRERSRRRSGCTLDRGQDPEEQPGVARHAYAAMHGVRAPSVDGPRGEGRPHTTPRGRRGSRRMGSRAPVAGSPAPRAAKTASCPGGAHLAGGVAANPVAKLVSIQLTITAQVSAWAAGGTAARTPRWIEALGGGVVEGGVDPAHRRGDPEPGEKRRYAAAV